MTRKISPYFIQTPEFFFDDLLVFNICRDYWESDIAELDVNISRDVLEVDLAENLRY